jgi:hypothetical protein
MAGLLQLHDHSLCQVAVTKIYNEMSLHIKHDKTRKMSIITLQKAISVNKLTCNKNVNSAVRLN